MNATSSFPQADIPLEALWVARIRKQDIRWYESPAGDQMPWIAAADVVALFSPSSDAATECQRLVQTEWETGARWVSTEDGPTLVVPHWCAKGLVLAGIDLGLLVEADLAAFQRATETALILVLIRLSPAELQDWVDRHVAAGEGA